MQFIIEQSDDKDFIEQINQIKQGVVIFVGLNYNADYNTIDKLDTPLHIYLDTEILFHMSGLNGVLYKDLFDELWKNEEIMSYFKDKQILKTLWPIVRQQVLDGLSRLSLPPISLPWIV